MEGPELKRSPQVNRDPENMQSDQHTEKLQKSEVLLYYMCEEWVGRYLF